MAANSLPLGAPALARSPGAIPSHVPLWRDPLFGLTLLLTIFAVAPFALPGYFWGANDARHHVYFLHQFDRLVQDGIWWPRWSPDFAFGYGYPFFNIYGPFSHFVAELLLHFGGFSYTAAIESVFGLSIVASAAAMYVCARDWAGRRAGVVAALVYTYLPYHLLNLYVRANLAESMAFVWLPLCLWSVRNAVVRPRKVAWVAAAALSYAGLMVTSNLVIVLFTPLLGLYLVLVAWLYGLPESELHIAPARRLAAAVRAGFWPALGLAAGLGLSAVFWIPALLEQKYVRVDQWFDGRYNYRGNFVYFSQLFSAHWGFGISQPGADDPISFQIGAAALVVALAGVLMTWHRAGRQRWEIAFFALGAFVSVGVALQVAAPLWEMPLLGKVLGTAQFPWRWYSVMAPCISLLAGLVVARFPGDANVERGAGAGAMHALDLQTLVAALVVLLASYPYLQVQISEPAEGPVSLAGLMRFQQSSDEMTGSTAWVKEIPTWSPMADYYIKEQEAGGPVLPVATLLDYGVFDYKTFGAHSVAHNSVMEEVYFDNQTDHEQRLIFNQFYYPGWRAFLLDGEGGRVLRELDVIPEEGGTLGRMTVPVPANQEGYMRLEYGDTPPRLAGRLITWGTAALLAAALAWSMVRRARAARSPRTLGEEP